MSSRPLNYTTTIPARRTVGECSDLLAEAGAARVAVVYEAKQPTGLSFRLEMPSGWQDFTLPVNIAAMHARLRRDRQAGAFASLKTSSAQLDKLTSFEHAGDVAWRVVKDWLEAQLALIAAEMASLDQVMLPYLQLAQGTLYEVVRDQQLALER